MRISSSSTAGSGNDSSSGSRKIVILAGRYSACSYRPNRSGSSGCSSATTTATFSSARATRGGSESSARRTCVSKLAISVVARLQRSLLRDRAHGQEPEREAADMGEERDAAALGRLQQPEAALPDLEPDPDAEEPDGRDLAQEDEPEEDQRQHPRPRQQE